MGALKDFYTCKKCSKLVMEFDPLVTVVKRDKIYYICPVCKTKNFKEFKKKKESK